MALFKNQGPLTRTFGVLSPRSIHTAPQGQAVAPLRQRGKSAALHLLHQFRQLGAEAGGLSFVFMHDGVFKQRT